MISVVVITLNEADRIPALLKSAAFADEVIVVDSGSTDGTQEISNAGGARVFTHPWEGFASQKQYAMDLASFEWILNLDADEWISDSLAAEIQEAI
jgi:glycosyltransferase involved in cell wall biosynthesis